eukprot:6185130-Pleurochrysis_carterae.AAC.1
MATRASHRATHADEWCERLRRCNQLTTEASDSLIACVLVTVDETNCRCERTRATPPPNCDKRNFNLSAK